MISAYLAQVRFERGADVSVALATRADLPFNQMALIHDLNAIFAAMFNSREFMDIAFTTDAQERQLSNVCRPFYRA